MKVNLILNKKNFKGVEDAVHIEDERLQTMINEVVNHLVESDECVDFMFSSTGDTFVCGFKFLEDQSINIIVTQDFQQAILTTDNNGKTWEPIDWSIDWDKEEPISTNDIMEEINRIVSDIEEIKKSIRPSYNPHREI